jgi:hypothetical protein
MRNIFRRNKPKLNAFTDFNIGNYAVKMYRLIADKFVEIDTIKIKIDEKKFTYGKKDFMFNPKHIAFSDAKNNYYAYDFDKGTPLKFNLAGLNEKGESNQNQQLMFKAIELPAKISIEDVDRYVNSGIIAQIIAGLEKPKSSKYGALLYIILGAVLGGAIGFIISQQITPTKTVYVIPTPTPTPPTVGMSLLYGILGLI